MAGSETLDDALRFKEQPFMEGVGKTGLTNPQLVQKAATLAENRIGDRGLLINHSFNNGVGNRGILDVLDNTNRF